MGTFHTCCCIAVSLQSSIMKLFCIATCLAAALASEAAAEPEPATNATNATLGDLLAGFDDLLANVTNATTAVDGLLANMAAATEACKDVKDAATKGMCENGHILAPDCACKGSFADYYAVLNNGREDVNTDECKSMQKLFDCSKKKDNWDNCKAIAGDSATYDKSVFKTQEDACAELLVSPASSSRAGFLVAIGAVGAAALML